MSTCTKISYADRAKALLALNAIGRAMKRKGRRGPRGAYLCASCRAWHLTSARGIQSPPWWRQSALP